MGENVDAIIKVSVITLKTYEFEIAHLKRIIRLGATEERYEINQLIRMVNFCSKMRKRILEIKNLFFPKLV